MISARDRVLQYLFTSIFNALHNFLENKQPNFLSVEELENWPKVTICNAEKSNLPLVFLEVPSSISNVLEVKTLGNLATQVVELNEWSDVTRIVRAILSYGKYFVMSQ